MLPQNLLKKAQKRAAELVDDALLEDKTELDFTIVEREAEELGIALAGLVAMVKACGATVSPRPVEKHVRGFTAKSDRWTACPSHGGSGWEQIAGFAGRAG